MLRRLRLLLLPFSGLFRVAVGIRSAYYASGKRSWRSPVPTVVIGNLSTGGTGKTPHALWLAEILLQHGRHPAMLSRGYGRKNRGFFEVKNDSRAREVGDEPLMMKRRFPELPVFVCESRVEGIQTLLPLAPKTDVLVLDDAFQHRALQPDLAIALLTYDSLQKPWFLLPAGDGRELLSALSRAQMVIVTKCPADLDETRKQILTDRLHKYTQAPIFFGNYRYLGLIDSEGKEVRPDPASDDVLLFSGIADPAPLEAWLRTRFRSVESVKFPDHHAFTRAELERVRQKADNRRIVTSEKDQTRLADVWPGFTQEADVLIVPVIPTLGADDKRFEHELMLRLPV